MSKIKIMIVDDLEHVRQGLRTIFELSEDIEIVGEANNGAEAVTLAGKYNPDVVLMDIEMPKIDGFEATQLIKNQYPGIGVVMISIHHTPEFLKRATESGVDAYLRKGIPSEVLFSTIQEVWKKKNTKVQNN